MVITQSSYSCIQHKYICQLWARLCCDMLLACCRENCYLVAGQQWEICELDCGWRTGNLTGWLQVNHRKYYRLVAGQQWEICELDCWWRTGNITGWLRASHRKYLLSGYGQIICGPLIYIQNTDKFPICQLWVAFKGNL